MYIYMYIYIMDDLDKISEEIRCNEQGATGDLVASRSNTKDPAPLVANMFQSVLGEGWEMVRRKLEFSVGNVKTNQSIDDRGRSRYAIVEYCGTISDRNWTS